MDNKKIAVIGSGIAGLSVAKMLQNKGHEVTVFEKNSFHGGLVHCTVEDGILFHRVGGHVFNTKIKEVAEWFWSFYKEDEFVKAKRNAKIWIDNKLVGYPIENYIFQLQKEKANEIVTDLLLSNKLDVVADNFADFLYSKFGKTLCDYYFKPYNYKIWKTDLSKIPLPWLDGKLPMPDVHSIIMNNIFKKEDDSMVHSYFFYPASGGSSFIADRIAEGLDIRYNSEILNIAKSDDKWIVLNQLFDDVIYTGDVRKIQDIIHIDDERYLNYTLKTKQLLSNGTSNALCYIDASDLSWLYLPEANTESHRIIYTGNFSSNNNLKNNKTTCTVEFSGIVSIEQMKAELSKLPFNIEPIAFNQEPNSYVIQGNETRNEIAQLKEFLSINNVYLLGRFAEWEYYNMDKAIEAAMNLVKYNF